MKKNVLFLLITMLILGVSAQAQRGVRIAYIDTEYILENVPEYQDAMSQLDDKAQKWKNEIQGKLSAIAQKRKDLSNEKVLLTKELIEEREEDIAFEEKEILDYQQKRFGPNGDLMIQQKQLMQPIQDQIFAAVQDMAANYDFIFDKSADVVMLYSAKRYDISDRVLRAITRTSKRKQAQTKAERKAAKEEEAVPEINYELEERQKALDEKKAARESAVEKRRQEILAAREAKKKEAEERRQKILEEREKAKQAKLDARNKAVAEQNDTTDNITNTTNSAAKTTETKETKTREQIIEENRQKKIAEREARKKALEEKRKKIEEERKKALEERQKARDSISKNK
ncbi:OmpH family outer membrane protein [Flavobacteriaceae bacterium MHTCC 0001]